MRKILPISMAALLLIQAVFGLCWQPARACIDLETAAELVCAHRCCDSGCEGNEEGTPSQAPCKCHLECSGICTFLAPEKPQVDSVKLVVALDDLSAYSALIDMRADGGYWTELAFGPAKFPPPLRLHLLHQVMLA